MRSEVGAPRNSLHTLKNSNRHSVLELLRHASPLSIAEIAERTGLSKVTVTKNIDHYLNDGVVVSTGKGESGEEGGKRPNMFAFNRNHRSIFCVKIDETHLLAALTDLEGNIVASHTVFYDAATGLSRVLDCVRDAFHLLMERQGLDESRCLGAVVGCHGVIDPELGICFTSPHFGGWGVDIPLRDLLRRVLPRGMPVHVNNWIHFHAYGEVHAMRIGVDRFFVIGTEAEGVAGGLVIDGRMYRGSGSLSGEIAHMIVDTTREAAACVCGGRGCFEAAVSPLRMAAKANGLLRGRPESLLARTGRGQATFADITAAANAGDALARELLDECLGHWAIAVTNILQICDPELIIIQGVYAAAGGYFLSRLQERIQTVSLVNMRKTVDIAYSTLGDEGTILGAGRFLADRHFANQAF